MSKRPPLGKLALAGKRNRERQLLDRERRERDRRDLLSSVGKNSSLAVSSSSGQGTPSRNERYAARVASAEKARLCVDTDIRAHGITDVAEKIVFDEMEVSLNLRLSLMRLMRNRIWVRRMMRTPMIHRDHLDPLVAERE